ncbi:unnamed protein product, partial [Scytosiphon promiscuus]
LVSRLGKGLGCYSHVHHLYFSTVLQSKATDVVNAYKCRVRNYEHWANTSKQAFRFDWTTRKVSNMAPHPWQIVRDTAGRLRDSMVRKERHLTGSEARWGDYQVMKKRWRRRTPASILMDDRMDEADRVYSRVSRPSTREGTGSNHPGSAVSGSVNSSRVCSASTCQR